VRKFAKWWLLVAAWMIVIFIGSSIGSLPRVGGKTSDAVVHRVAHVIEFAVLGALTLRALRQEQPITRREVIATLIIVALYGVSDEVHQRFTPGRSSEGSAVVFDMAGGLIGAWAYRWWFTQRRANRRLEQVLARPAESEVAADRAFDQLGD
jgi:VanZ family protein